MSNNCMYSDSSKQSEARAAFFAAGRQTSLGYVRHTGTLKGRGVFATRTIMVDEIIEVCPVVMIKAQWSTLPPEIQKIVFHWGALAQMPEFTAIALGYGCLYNHANPANARYKATDDGECLIISAAAPIACDTEITINYNAAAGEPLSCEDNWFEQNGVVPFEPDASLSTY